MNVYLCLKVTNIKYEVINISLKFIIKVLFNIICC